MKFLVIENDKKLATSIKHKLVEERYEVDTARDGESGLEMVVGGSYSLIVLDAELPKRDGISVAQTLRARKNMVPIIMISTQNSVEHIVAGLNAGADYYLTKPFAYEELGARVNALLRRSQLDRGTEILFADLRIDPVTHKVWRKDVLIELTGKEYALLEFFMRNPNQVLTRATIAEQVWADSVFDRFTNIIDVYINYLRKKLERDGTRRLLQTVRGLGYMLTE